MSSLKKQDEKRTSKNQQQIDSSSSGKLFGFKFF
jgi:hypothetical protein